jgi:hypothetical protein
VTRRVTMRNAGRREPSPRNASERPAPSCAEGRAFPPSREPAE